MATPYARRLLGLQGKTSSTDSNVSMQSASSGSGGRSSAPKKPTRLPQSIFSRSTRPALVRENSFGLDSPRGSTCDIDRLSLQSRPSSTGEGGSRRRAPIAAGEADPHDKHEPRQHMPKSSASKRVIAAAIAEHFLFATLSHEEVNFVIDSMQREMKAPTEAVIEQGDVGDKFYVLEQGDCDIYVDRQLVGQIEDGGSFGELALMYNCPRAASIIATRSCTLWSLDRRTFRRLLATASSSSAMAQCQFLSNVPLLQPLSKEQLTKVAGALSTEEFATNEYIVRQGEQGEKFYIIKEGHVKCTHRKGEADRNETELLRLAAGDYFGEMALLLDEPRHANVIAQTPVVCNVLDRSSFLQLLGPLQDLLNQQMRIRILKSVPLLSNLSDSNLDLVANSMRVQVFADGEYVIRQGEEGSRFFIINEGDVKITKTTPSGEEEFAQLHAQDYFGEMALMRNEPRANNVIAVGRVECLVLERADFNHLLGNVEQLMEKEMKRRRMMQQQLGDREPIRQRPRGPPMKFEELRQLRTIGTGTFGRVKLVQHVPSGRVCALKTMQKAQIVASHQERNIMNEKNILAECQHPFILELVQTYSSPNQLFMLMEIVQGGELWTYIYEKPEALPRTALKGFQISTARFYASCVISAFEYVHSLGVAYRDLKPENLLLDHQGFIKVIDFGFAKHIPYFKGTTEHMTSFTLCGTPEYLSPELVMSRGHDKSVDYWALGCLVYELIVGRTPFQDDVQSEIFKKIMRSDRSLRFPPGFDPDAKDLVQKLLTPNPAFRLGNMSGLVNDIKNHDFYRGFDWDALYQKNLEAPYVPQIRDPLDTSNFDPYPEDDRVPPYSGPQRIFEGF